MDARTSVSNLEAGKGCAFLRLRLRDRALAQATRREKACQLTSQSVLESNDLNASIQLWRT
jgi:hypothetical protein